MLHLPPVCGCFLWMSISFPCCLYAPQKEQGWGSRQRGAASFAAEALPALPISGVRSQHCPPQREAANKLIRIMGK